MCNPCCWEGERPRKKRTFVEILEESRRQFELTKTDEQTTYAVPHELNEKDEKQ
jgi:hypothetical protein